MSDHKIVENKDNEIEKILNEAASLQSKGKYSDALKLYDNAISKNPNNAEVYYKKAIIFNKLHNHEESLTYLNKAIALNFKDPIYLISKGNLLIEMGKDNEANEIFDKAIELDPNNEIVYFSKGNYYYNEGSYSESISMYCKSISINPEYHLAVNNLANAYLACNDNENAVKYYDQAIYLDPEYILSYKNKGLALFNLGKVEEAIDTVNQALKYNSKESSLYNFIGNVYYFKGELENAISYYDKAIQINDKNPLYYYNKALVLEKNGNLKQADELLNNSLTCNPNFTPSILAKISIKIKSFLQTQNGNDKTKDKNKKELNNSNNIVFTILTSFENKAIYYPYALGALTESPEKVEALLFGNKDNKVQLLDNIYNNDLPKELKEYIYLQIQNNSNYIKNNFSYKIFNPLNILSLDCLLINCCLDIINNNFDLAFETCNFIIKVCLGNKQFLKIWNELEAKKNESKKTKSTLLKFGKHEFYIEITKSIMQECFINKACLYYSKRNFKEALENVDKAILLNPLTNESFLAYYYKLIIESELDNSLEKIIYSADNLLIESKSLRLNRLKKKILCKEILNIKVKIYSTNNQLNQTLEIYNEILALYGIKVLDEGTTNFKIEDYKTKDLCDEEIEEIAVIFYNKSLVYKSLIKKEKKSKMIENLNLMSNACLKEAENLFKKINKQFIIDVEPSSCLSNLFLD